MTTTNTERNHKQALKAVRCADLAISAESIGNVEESNNAARMAGRLTYTAGCTLAELHSCLDAVAIAGASATWAAIVDAWYDAAEA